MIEAKNVRALRKKNGKDKWIFFFEDEFCIDVNCTGTFCLIKTVFIFSDSSHHDIY